MMPAESVFGSFRKMVRDLAGSEGKQVEVVVEGLDCEADRLVLQRVKDPVMHILRNAVSHGIEPPDERAEKRQVAARAAWRSASPTITTGLIDRHRGRRARHRLPPHGGARRSNWAACRRRRRRRQRRERWSQLVFEPGFSTAASVTTISGRGVGLSVARETVVALQGGFDVAAMPGQGTRIALSLPVSVLSRRLLAGHLQGPGLRAADRSGGARAARRRRRIWSTVEGRPAVRRRRFDAAAGVDRRGARPRRPRGRRRCVGHLRRRGAGRRGRDAGAGHPLGIAVEGFVGVNDFVVRNRRHRRQRRAPVVRDHRHARTARPAWCSIPPRS